MDFINENEIVAADASGRLTLIKGIESKETTSISIITTKVARFRDIKCFPGSNVLATISSEGKICFYDIESLRQFDLEIGTVKPIKSIKSKSRILSMTINCLTNKENEKEKGLLKKRKKNKKLSKDEKLILKR
jgi:hypothetical protein